MATLDEAEVVRLRTQAQNVGAAWKKARDMIDECRAQADELVVALSDARQPVWQIAEDLQISSTTVVNIRTAHGITVPRRKSAGAES